MNQRGILSHVQKVFFIPQKSIRWIYVWTKLKCWFVLKNSPPPFPIHTLNTWRKIASWVILQFTTPRLTLQNKTFCIPRKLTCRVSFEIYPSQRYKDYSWTFWNLPTPWPYKSIHSTYGSSWHVDSFYWIYLPCPLQNILFNVWISMASWPMLKCSLPSPTTKPYIEHMKKRNLESFLKFKAHRPYKTTRWTYGEISHVEWCLGFPSLRPCRTNGLRYEESCHAESFLKFTSPRPYLASTPFNKWTNLACWVIVEDLLPCALQKYTFKVVQQTNLFGILRHV